MGSILDTEQAHSKKRTGYFKLIQSIKLSLTLLSRTSQCTVRHSLTSIFIFRFCDVTASLKVSRITLRG